MCIPGPPLAAYPDRVLVHAPSVGRSADGQPLTTPGAVGLTALACSVQETSGESQGTTRQDAPDAPFGLTRYEILFPSDPGVTVTDQRIDWIADAAGMFASAIVLITEGGSRPPRGLSRNFKLSATARGKT